MSLRLVLVPGLLALLLCGCLENLNQQKYFDVLEATAPELSGRVQRHRESIESQLVATLEARSPAPIDHVGLWGESWDLVRKVSDGEQLFMRGRIFHPEGPASTYYLAFTVAEDGTIEVQDVLVSTRRGGPQ